MRLWITAILFMSILNGCQMGNENRANEERNNASVQQNQRVPQTSPEKPKEQGPGATADRLAALATKVPQVNDATVIVFGKTAIVGIDVNAKLDRPRVGTIKYTVAEALKKDPQGATAVVVADPDVVQRLREINQDIQRGRPIAGFAEELADIAGRFVPQMPNDIDQR